MAKIDEAAQAAQQTQVPENPSAEPTTQEPVKKDNRKKDPSEPKVMPFQLVTPATRERLLNIGKPNEETLAMLLDVYEHRAASADPQSQAVIEGLQNEIKQLKLNLQEQQNTINANTSTRQPLDSTISQLKADIEAKDQEIAAKKQEIADKDGEIAEKSQRISELESTAPIDADAEIQAQLQQLTDRATRAEDEVKDNRITIKGLNDAKKELEKQLKQAQKDLESARNAYLNIKRNGEEALPLNHYPEGDILHFLPTVTARLLERTAEKLTDCRTDGKVVTPANIVGDMFNRYIIERWNLWFFKWVLSDNEILEIAQEVEPKIQSIRMLKAALNIQ